MTFKKIFFLLIFILFGTNSIVANPIIETEKPLHRIIMSGDNDYMPYSAIDENGKPIGISVEMAKAIGNKLGIQIEFDLKPWAQAQKDLRKGKVDMLLNFSGSPERAEYSTFSAPYVFSPVCVFKNLKHDVLTKISELDGQEVLVVKGDLSIDFLNSINSKAKIIEVSGYKELINKLERNRKVGYAIIDKNTGLYWIKLLKTKHVEPTNMQMFYLNYSFAALKQNQNLVAAFNDAYSKLIETGEYQKMQRRWLKSLEIEDTTIRRKIINYAVIVCAILITIVVLVLLWSYVVNQKVKDKTISLEEMNKALDSSKEHYKALLNINPDMIFILDSHNCFIDYYGGGRNENYPVTENFIGKKVYEIFPPALSSMFEKKLDILKNTNEMQIFNYQMTLNNLLRYYECRIIMCTTNEVLAIVRDITETKKVEEKLHRQNKELEKHYEEYMQLNTVLQQANHELELAKISAIKDKIELNSLMENLSGMVYRCDYDDFYTMRFASKGTFALTGYRPDELINNRVQRYRDVILEEDQNMVSAIIRSGVKSRNYYVLDYRIKTKNGDIRNVWERGKALIDENGRVYALQGIISDVTERERIKNELAEQNAKYEIQNREYSKLNATLTKTNLALNQAKEKIEESDKLRSAFIRNISHEIRTPLNGIMGYSSLLNAVDVTKKDILEYTSIINSSGNRLIEIINNLMDASKLETGQMEIIPKSFIYNELLQETYEYFSKVSVNESIELCLSPLDEKVEIYSDKERIRQVINILMSNAYKFTNEGCIEFGSIIDMEKYMLVTYVKDTGTGIKDDNNIFATFSQADLRTSRNYEGAGLGLSIAKGLVGLMGGKIWYETEVDKGSTFYFSIPLM